MWQDPIVKEVREPRFEIEKDAAMIFIRFMNVPLRFKRAVKIQKKLAKKHVSGNGTKARHLSRA